MHEIGLAESVTERKDHGLWSDFEFRGLIYQSSDPIVAEKLDAPAGGGEPLVAYTGFDPTADSLHVGHLLPIFNMRRLQMAGHKPILLAGGGTGLIGDPGGRSEERKLLDRDTLDANLAGVKSQLERFVDFDQELPNSAILVDNSDWLSGLKLLEFLRDTGKHFSVGQMIAKDSVRTRLESAEKSISFTEFSYMLLQSYDFLHLFETYGCRLQLGASDQWGNITSGIDLVRRLKGETVWGLTTPLLTKPDGTKFGKSASGSVWLDADKSSPYELYQFFLNTEDGVVASYLRKFTFLSHERILELETLAATKPELREAQKALAFEVVTMVHGEKAVSDAIATSAALFSEDLLGLGESQLLDAFSDAPSATYPISKLEEGLLIVDLMAETGLEKSKGAARRTVEQGGAYLNNKRITDPDATVSKDQLISGSYAVLRKGKKSNFLVSFK